MADHVHHRGEWMFGYRYMFMRMEQNYAGDNTIPDSEIITPAALGGRGFLITPTRMETQMHILSAMYAPIDHFTLMLMAPYTLKHMIHLARNGTVFSTSSDGIGDISLAGLYRLFNCAGQTAHVTLGMSFPTGSITATDGTPLGVQRLPYPMQLGSGTFDLLPGITYLGQCGRVSWGTQISGVVRLGENDEDYRLGHAGRATAWGAYEWNDWVSTSLRVTYSIWGNIAGADPELAPRSTVITTADTDARGGQRIELSAGVNFYVPYGPLKNNRLAVEAGIPVFQNLDGPQLGSDWSLMAGWQYSF